MNIYLLVEGEETELQVYSFMLKYFNSNLSQVSKLSAISNNNFFILSGFGYPSILKRIENSFKDVNQNGKIDYLLICLDTEGAPPWIGLKKYKTQSVH